MNYKGILKLSAIFLFIAASLVAMHFSYQKLFTDAEKYQTASISQAIASEVMPLQKPDTQTPELSAKSFLSLYVSNSGSTKTLVEKSSSEKMLIASISKLMAAVIVQENYKPDDVGTIDDSDVLQGGWLKSGESFTVKNLLYAALINSDNSAAYQLSKIKDRLWFVGRMNQKAKDWGLDKTYFANSVGFGLENVSTVKDLATMSQQIYREHPEIFEITRNKKYAIFDSAGNFHHTAYSTNEFWPDGIIGVKTGNNEVAGECLLMIIKSPNDNGYIVNVILNSRDRFSDMKNLVNWENISYNW